nr:hypothetical protein [Belnapia mucosa]
MPLEGIEPSVQVAEPLGKVPPQRIGIRGGRVAVPRKDGTDDGIAPEAEGGREVAGIGQGQLPMGPGAAVAAAGGGNEAVRVEADNFILDDILTDLPLGVGPVRLAGTVPP